MYKMNLLIKFIVTVLTIAIVILTNNRIVLWLLLVLLSFYNLLKNKSKKLLLIDLILVILLGLSTNHYICLLLFKLLLIFNFSITVLKSVTYNDFKDVFKQNVSSKTYFYEDNFDKVVKRINDKKNAIYDKDISIDHKIESDLERLYLQSKIRYDGLYKKNKWDNWSKIDILILLFVVIVFIILFILR